MRISKAHLRQAVIAALLVCAPAGMASAQGFFGKQQQQSRRVQQGSNSGGGWFGDGGEGGGSQNSNDDDWIRIIPGIVDGLLQSDGGEGKPRPPRPPRPPQYVDDYDEPNYYPPRPRNTPPPPADTPKANKLPPKKIEPLRNPPIFNGFGLTEKELADAIEQKEEELDAKFDELEEKLPSEEQLKNELVAAGIAEADAKKIADEIRDGKLSPQSEQTLNTTLGPAGVDKATDLATAWGAVDEARDAALDGSLTKSQLEDVKDAFADVGVSPATTAAVDKTLDDIGVSSTIHQVLLAATPNTTTLPTGTDNLLVLLPTLPAGTVVSLGSGMVLIGGASEEDGPSISTGSVAEAAGLPIEGTPAADNASNVVTSGTLLLNQSEVEVNYVLNGKSYSMQSGFSQPLAAGATWVVEFDKGNDQGTAKYTLKPGTYAFEATDNGWELYRQSYSATIDNASSPIAFNYVLNNEAQLLAAGEKKEHTSDYPLIVRFEDGAGAFKQKKLGKGTFQVGIDIATNTLELLDGSTPRTEIAANAPDAKKDLFGASTRSKPTDLFGKKASRLNREDAPWRITESLASRKRSTAEREQVRKDAVTSEPFFPVAGEPSTP